MDALNNNDLPESKRNSSLLLGFSTLLSIFLWIIGFDTLTEKEHLDAGVDLSGEGRDEQDSNPVL
jgi:hypothetical protein